MKPNFTIHPVGTVERKNDMPFLVIDPEYREALLGLEDFSHVYVLCWADRLDSLEHRSVLHTLLPYAEGVSAGVFACRSPQRPNPLLVSLCRVSSGDHGRGTVAVDEIDVFSGTPIIDLKPYYPVTDRVQQALIPAYLQGWPEWFPAEGIGLMPHELDLG